MKNKLYLQRAAVIVLILCLWEAAALALDQSLLLASPAAVIVRLGEMLVQPAFLSSVWFTFTHIVGGFFAALIFSIPLAALSAAVPFVEILLWPLLVTVKSVPVASFIVICLIWLTTAQLSIFISFLMVFPIIYTSVLEGIKSTDSKLLDMATVFRLPLGRRLVYIRLEHIKPFLLSSCKIALGLSWKAGIAAEVIGIPSGSIGEALYESKVYLNTVDLFAWTVVIVLISVAFEKLFILLLKRLFILIEHRKKPLFRCPSRLKNGNLQKRDIVIDGIYKAFGKKQVLTDFSMLFKSSSRTCITGESGCGKTTLLNIIARLDNADQGSLLNVPENKAMVFQEDRLCENFSSFTNVMLAAKKGTKEKDIYTLLDRMKLNGNEHIAVNKLSGGMKRRVALARALAADFELIILDEPFKGLDLHTKDNVIEAVNDMTRGKTLIAVTHDKSECTRLNAELFSMKNISALHSENAPIST